MRNGIVMAALVMASAAGSLVTGGAAPASPQPPATVVDDFAYADAGAAGAAWQPMWGTASPAPVQADGRKALRMPCNFKGTKIERASWDRSVRLDMTACRAVRFSLLCRDPTPVSGFSLYLQSGGGWYSAHFAPGARGTWSTITIDKEDMGTEGRPAGWGQVRTIRISAWRGTDVDTEFLISDMVLLGEQAAIAVIRGESAAQTAPREMESVIQFTRSTTACLKDLGLDYAVVSDLDLTAERFKQTRLVILPHNPSLPDAAAEVLIRFLEGGGKMVAFYAVPEKLRQTVGMESGRHVPQQYDGHFASIRFGDGAIKGAPPVVGQRSWNIQGAKAVEGRSRVAATWFNQDGKDTGWPAVLVSNNCIYMTHVLIQDDAAGKRRMLLALAGHLAPDLWRQAAEASVERARQSEKETAARVRLAAVPPGRLQAAAAELGKARAALAEAAALSKEGKFSDAIERTEKVQRSLAEAWCLAQRSLPGEFRALWCHSAFGPAGMEWDEAVKMLADNGFTAILPNMLWAGAAFFESKVLPVAPQVRERGDQIAKCLAACRKYGIQCHVWKVNWNMGGRAPRDFLERMKKDGRTQVRFDGKAQDQWLCPSHPENRKLEIDSMVEVATAYDVDGIHFDYIRYPDRDGCFCGGCRQRFEASTGAKVADWPGDLRKVSTLEAKWLQWRRDNITQVISAVSEKVRRERPKCRISAAVFLNWPVDRDNVGQDWKLWCERSYVDFVCPMDYTPHTSAFEDMVARQIGWAGKVPCYPGIGLSTWPSQTDISKLIDQIETARRQGTKGFTIFEFNATTARQIVPLCGKGITAKE
jgi:uncharacterized lipoprotein YddW (UPF0748 family)